MRALGVTSLKRTTLAPDMPTIDESGLRGFELQQFYSIVAPAGTPAEIVQRLNQEIVQRLPTEDVKQRLAHEGDRGADVSTPAELGEALRRAVREVDEGDPAGGDQGPTSEQPDPQTAGHSHCSRTSGGACAPKNASC